MSSLVPMPKTSPKQPSFRSMPLSDQIDTLHKRAAELDFKQTLTSLNRLLMEKRDLLPGIVRHLQGSGVELPRAAKLGSKRAQEPEGSPTEQADANDHPEPAGPPAKVRRCGVKDPNPHNWLPHSYTRLDNCKSPVLEKLLTSLEEIAFSQYALKSLKGKKTSSTEYQVKLLELLEYETGFDPSKPLVADYRHIPTLHRHLMIMRDERGSRGATLRLPPTWGRGSDGIFDLEASPGAFCVVVNKSSGCRLTLSATIALQDTEGNAIEADELEIVNNFSEAKACISSHVCTDTILIASLAGLDASCTKEEINDADATSPDKPSAQASGELEAKTSCSYVRRRSWLVGSKAVPAGKTGSKETNP